METSRSSGSLLWVEAVTGIKRVKRPVAGEGVQCKRNLSCWCQGPGLDPFNSPLTVTKRIQLKIVQAKILGIGLTSRRLGKSRSAKKSTPESLRGTESPNLLGLFPRGSSFRQAATQVATARTRSQVARGMGKGGGPGTLCKRGPE